MIEHCCCTCSDQEGDDEHVPRSMPKENAKRGAGRFGRTHSTATSVSARSFAPRWIGSRCFPPTTAIPIQHPNSSLSRSTHPWSARFGPGRISFPEGKLDEPRCLVLFEYEQHAHDLVVHGAKTPARASFMAGRRVVFLDTILL